MPKPVSLTFFNCTLCVFIVSYHQRFDVGDYSKALKQYKFANYQTATPKPLLTEIYTEPRKKLSLGLLKNILFLQWYVNSNSFWVLRTIRWAKEMILFTYTVCSLVKSPVPVFPTQTSHTPSVSSVQLFVSKSTRHMLFTWAMHLFQWGHKSASSGLCATLQRIHTLPKENCLKQF